MKLKNLLLTALLTALETGAMAQTQVAHFDMSLHDGKTTETVTNTDYIVSSQLPACTITGIDGEALRFDGYSNYVRASLPVSTFSTEAMTISVTLAAETYPMMQVDVAEETPTFATICGNLDEETKSGFAFELSSQGDLRFRYGSASGFVMTILADEKLPRGEWCLLTATLDKANNAASLYLNGRQIATGRMGRADIVHSTTDFYIGKNQDNVTDPWTGKMLLNAFCGAIDDISISNEVTDFTLINLVDMSQFRPDFNYPAERYTDNIWRPQFHGMPSGAWTNETHGMTYSDGRYHVFFQKNANGPYMSRLHWGHISSENLYDWREEPIAIAPGESYDIKGCWSGSVYEDGGDTYILYTAVDNARATIAQAKATDASLKTWEKQGIVINGTPAGGFADFRDPYYFEANGQKYVIVGTGKNGVGCCTLHKYENGAWTNDGTVFFQGSTANLHGTFWEMPNVTPMDDDKWLFTCTPLGTGIGVRALCWAGTIGSDGKFTPDAVGVQYLEMGGISKDGFGLLSPTIYQKDGKTLLLGIVPDKLATQKNFEMGWAHNYSLPREISLAADGTLIQKPYSGLEGMRTETTCEKNGALTGIESLAPVSGRQIELLGEFTVASGTCGFNFLKSGSQQASLTYDTDRGTLTLDLTQLLREQRDPEATYNGIYAITLPKKVNAGEKLTLHVWLDGSIADIFVNDTWAFSVRLFPKDAEATGAEVFATAEMQASVRAWTLDPKQGGDTGIKAIGKGQSTMDHSVYDLLGRKVLSAEANSSLFTIHYPLRKGVYIKNGRKYVGR
ncbi:MAG: GH32 C-terminal domain-containing protein [Prevotella sp.]|nr:GH32 C-terminal domain-containing protein [Prevotella sp.]